MADEHIIELKLKHLEETVEAAPKGYARRNRNKATAMHVRGYRAEGRWRYFADKVFHTFEDGKRRKADARFCWGTQPFKLDLLDGRASWLSWVEVHDGRVWRVTRAALYEKRKDAKAAAFSRYANKSTR